MQATSNGSGEPAHLRSLARALLFAHMTYGSRRRVQQKIRHLAPLEGCACAFEESVYGGQKVPNLMRWLLWLFFNLTQVIIRRKPRRQNNPTKEATFLNQVLEPCCNSRHRNDPVPTLGQCQNLLNSHRLQRQTAVLYHQRLNGLSGKGPGLKN